MSPQLDASHLQHQVNGLLQQLSCIRERTYQGEKRQRGAVRHTLGQLTSMTPLLHLSPCVENSS